MSPAVSPVVRRQAGPPGDPAQRNGFAMLQAIGKNAPRQHLDFREATW